jgi:hypothetical protein
VTLKLENGITSGWKGSRFPSGVQKSGYTIITTCKLNSINPEEYLHKVLPLLAVRPEDANVTELLPINWYKKNHGDVDPQHTPLYPSKH